MGRHKLAVEEIDRDGQMIPVVKKEVKIKPKNMWSWDAAHFWKEITELYEASKDPEVGDLKLRRDLLMMLGAQKEFLKATNALAASQKEEIADRRSKKKGDDAPVFILPAPESSLRDDGYTDEDGDDD